MRLRLRTAMILAGAAANALLSAQEPPAATPARKPWNELSTSWIYYVQASWALTGETRPYGRACGCFGQLEPSSPFSFRHGGTGAFEVGARYSNIDLTSGEVDGGKFDRWSGALSWFPTGAWRLEFNYGYGRLRRSGITGRTHFYQLRLPWEI